MGLKYFLAIFLINTLLSYSVHAQTFPAALPSKAATPPAPKTVDDLNARLKPQVQIDAAAQQQRADACLADLKSGGIEAERAEQPPSDNVYCSVEAPVRLLSASLGSGGKITFPDRPLLACAFAKEFARFSTRVLNALSVDMLGGPLAVLGTGPGYECRFRNRASSGKMSAHGRGLGVDLQRFKTATGAEFTFAGAASDKEKLFVSLFPRAACGFFSTVLGPSSGAMHKDHIHVDMEPRRQRYGSFCQP